MPPDCLPNNRGSTSAADVTTTVTAAVASSTENEAEYSVGVSAGVTAATTGHGPNNEVADLVADMIATVAARAARIDNDENAVPTSAADTSTGLSTTSSPATASASATPSAADGAWEEGTHAHPPHQQPIPVAVTVDSASSHTDSIDHTNTPKNSDWHEPCTRRTTSGAAVATSCWITVVWSSGQVTIDTIPL